MALLVKNLSKTYHNKSGDVKALDDVDLKVEDGEIVALVGPSGSGKTTLVQILSLMLAADEGEVYLDNKEILDLKDEEKAKIRNQALGIVVQNFALLEDETVEKNLEIPFYYAPKKTKKKDRQALMDKYLDLVDLSGYRARKVDTLSGGQKQRVAIVRSLLMNPSVILADEPTGALDQETGQEIFNLLESLAHKQNKCILVVTHDLNLAKAADRSIALVDGKV